jgi:hypothetical protein
MKYNHGDRVIYRCCPKCPEITATVFQSPVDIHRYFLIFDKGSSARALRDGIIDSLFINHHRLPNHFNDCYYRQFTSISLEANILKFAPKVPCKKCL